MCDKKVVESDCSEKSEAGGSDQGAAPLVVTFAYSNFHVGGGKRCATCNKCNKTLSES